MHSWPFFAHRLDSWQVDRSVLLRQWKHLWSKPSDFYLNLGLKERFWNFVEMPYCFFSNLLIKLYAFSVLFIVVLYLARQAMETISVYIACLSNLVAAILRGAAIRLDGSDALNTIKLCGFTPWEVSVFLCFSVFFILSLVLLSFNLLHRPFSLLAGSGISDIHSIPYW